MVRGNEVLVKLDGQIVAMQTDCELNAAVEMVEYVPLPGSDEDDGWAHYVQGGRQWSVSNNSFLTVSDRVVSKGIAGSKVDVVMLIGDDEMTGKAVVESVDIDAQHKTYAKVSLGLAGEDWPRF